MGQEWHRCCAQALPHCSRPGFLPKRQPQPCCLLSHEKQCTEAKPPAFSSLWHPNSGKNEDQPEEFHPPLFLKHLIYNLKQPGHLASSLCLVLWHLLWLLQFPAWEGWKFHDSPPPFKQVPALGLSHPWWDDLQSKAFLTWAHWALGAALPNCLSSQGCGRNTHRYQLAHNGQAQKIRKSVRPLWVKCAGNGSVWGTGAFWAGEKRNSASLLMCLSEQAAAPTKTGKDLGKHTCNSWTQNCPKVTILIASETTCLVLCLICCHFT